MNSGTTSCDVCAKPLPIHVGRGRPRKRHVGCRQSRPSKNRTRTERRKLPTKFYAIDGEGITYPDGRHEYILISIAGEDYYEYLESVNGEVLDFCDILTFLWLHCNIIKKINKGRKVAFVGYYLGYDFEQWKRTLPSHRLESLYTPMGIAMRKRNQGENNRFGSGVWYRDWEFDILNEKRFRFRIIPQKLQYGREHENEEKWLHICDCGPIFQMPFAQASDPREWPNLDIITPKEQRIIAHGKAHRSCIIGQCEDVDCTAVPGEKMREYNKAENVILTRMMGHISAALLNIDLQLSEKQWFGPGQVAQKWMYQVAKPHTSEELQKIYRSDRKRKILDVARMTYYGGWFEITAHGHIPGTTYGYDINSAYPHSQSQLPCLRHGKWTQGNNGTEINWDHPYTIVYGYFRGNQDNLLGPLPCRRDNGTIYRPVSTEGWYWLHEIAMAKRAGMITATNIRKWWQYDPCDCEPPWYGLRELYKHRLEVGKGTPLGKVYKLIYNSTYGKTAQSVGEPKFANAIHASLITAGCRTQILEAIATHPNGVNDVLMIATDGIYFRTPHPNLDRTPGVLGAWEEKTHENLTLLMPGMYWDDKVRNEKDERAKFIRSRGTPAKAFADSINQLDDQFNMLLMENYNHSWAYDNFEWPSVTIPIPFQMITAKQAMHRGDWSLVGKVITDGVRVISANPVSKRMASGYHPQGFYSFSDPRPLDSVIYRSEVYPYQQPTVPYDKRFGMELRSDMEILVDKFGDGDMLEHYKYILGL